MPAGTASLDDVTCASATQCYLGGPATTASGPAPLYTTSDGGDTWQATTAPGTLTAIAGMACPAANDCVIVGRDGTQPEVDSTTDGTSWSTDTLPMSVVTGPLAANTSNS